MNIDTETPVGLAEKFSNPENISDFSRYLGGRFLRDINERGDD